MHKKSERDVILEGLKSGENIRKSKTLQRLGASIGNCGSWWSRGKPWWPRQKSHASEKPLSQHSSQALTAKCVWECELKREWRMGKSPATNMGTEVKSYIHASIETSIFKLAPKLTNFAEVACSQNSLLSMPVQTDSNATDDLRVWLWQRLLEATWSWMHFCSIRAWAQGPPHALSVTLAHWATVTFGVPANLRELWPSGRSLGLLCVCCRGGDCLYRENSLRLAFLHKATGLNVTPASSWV